MIKQEELIDADYLDGDQHRSKGKVIHESALMQAAARPVGVNPILSKLITR